MRPLMRAAAAVPDLKAHRQLHRALRRRGAVDPVREHRHRGVPEGRQRLNHGGETGPQVAAELDAVEPGDRDVTRYGQARVLQRRDGPDRRLVVGAHQGPGYLSGGDDLLADPAAARGGEVAVISGPVRVATCSIIANGAVRASTTSPSQRPAMLSTRRPSSL